MRLVVVLLVVSALVGAAPPALAQGEAPAPGGAGDPVLFVHGLSYSDLAWRDVATALAADGYGLPYTIHADLNASERTDAASDVVVSEIVPTRRRPDRTPVAVGGGAAERVDSRLFFVNFEAVADTAAGTLAPYARRGAGRSESNESGVVKQGAALGRAVRAVLAATGAERVVLVGQSMGGLAVREYLQRRDADGRPRWWAEPDRPDGHRVSAAVTYGTPHQGSNLGAGLCDGEGGGSLLSVLTEAFAGARTEAIRDLRAVYPCSALGAGRYLYGGDEADTDEFEDFDVDADGAVGGAVVGINAGDPGLPYAVDNPAMPLPPDVEYVYVVGSVFGLGTDLVVEASRQVLQRRDGARPALAPEGARRVVTGRPHLQQTRDVQTIREVLASLGG
ncbi:esterase/lipase family protein [Rubrivirga litoralis]|uniref:PGAP1-like protein n=1 Tax=Rubrivirga litoralis TaxID=3075598 RepID=A0ABU3BRM7_9BACT|nr:hypothetical protein [Rubrivirga sp. F394]MDT0631836.1 hypothetical protein [Rubrivirga sp. F394]